MIDKIPKPVLVAIVLICGVAALFVIQAPHSVCTNQMDVFKESQLGFLYPKQVKKSVRPAIFSRLMENCKIGNSPGACYELFTGLRKMVRDLGASSNECFPSFAESPELRDAMAKSIELIARLAWGNRPPELGMEKFGWMEPLDLALFCQLKISYLKVFGEEGLEKLRLATYTKLPGEAEVYAEDGTCTNCELRKSADQAFSAEEIWARSLFSFRCERVM